MINTKKSIILISFALFSLFFGAGNLILPPLLGYKAGPTWWLVALGFCLSAVLIPILGIIAHAKLQGTMFDFAKKVSPVFSLVYCYVVYAISISLPSPRTASVTHEIAIAPFFVVSPWLTSTIYFALVLVFVLYRSALLNVIGKLLTPAILLILVTIIAVAIFNFDPHITKTHFENPFTSGILEGYQTFDAIGAVVVGGVIIISMNLKDKTATYRDKKGVMIKSGLLAGLGLFLVYAGLLFSGALMQRVLENEVSRTALLSALCIFTLGNTANIMLSILVSLACFTTAVGIVTGTADFMKDRFLYKNAYAVTAVIGCLLGIIMGQFPVSYIIIVAIPALMIIYPVTIVLIFLNVLPSNWTSNMVFRAVVVTTIVFSLPDFMHSLGVNYDFSWIPLNSVHMGWVLPAFIALISTAFMTKSIKKV